MDREKLEETIRGEAWDGKMPCAICFKIVEEFGITKKEMGEVLNQLKIKISQCQLGGFAEDVFEKMFFKNQGLEES